MTPDRLEGGYWHAHRDSYWHGSIGRGAWTKSEWTERLRHLAYAGAWKKGKPMWDWVSRAKRVPHCYHCWKQSSLALTAEWLKPKHLATKSGRQKV